MCLYLSENYAPAQCGEDVVVYKIVTTTRTRAALWNSSSRTVGDYYSPFQGKIYALGELYSANIQITRKPYHIDTLRVWALDTLNAVDNSKEYQSIPVIEEGLHTFTSYDDALTYCNNHPCDINFVILKCVIPAGSVFYRGQWAYKNSVDEFGIIDSYASEQLRVIEEMK